MRTPIAVDRRKWWSVIGYEVSMFRGLLRLRGQIFIQSEDDPQSSGWLVGNIIPESKVLHTRNLRDFCTSPRTQAYSLVADGGGLIAQGRRPWPFDRRRLLVLDGTANTEILGQFVPSLGTVPEIRVRRNARVIQVSNMTFYRGSLNRRTSTREATSEGRHDPMFPRPGASPICPWRAICREIGCEFRFTSMIELALSVGTNRIGNGSAIPMRRS